MRLGLYPNLGVSWFWACVVGVERPLVFVGDHEAPLPRGDELELRAPGLWTDISCLEPLERFSVQLEAFGVGVDDPAEMYGRMRGDQVPVGFDLEWETDGGVFGYPEGITRYEVPCVVHGEILVGREKIDFDGFGQRDHSWGVRDWWASRGVGSAPVSRVVSGCTASISATERVSVIAPVAVISNFRSGVQWRWSSGATGLPSERTY